MDMTAVLPLPHPLVAASRFVPMNPPETSLHDFIAKDSMIDEKKVLIESQNVPIKTFAQRTPMQTTTTSAAIATTTTVVGLSRCLEEDNNQQRGKIAAGEKKIHLDGAGDDDNKAAATHNQLHSEENKTSKIAASWDVDDDENIEDNMTAEGSVFFTALHSGTTIEVVVPQPAADDGGSDGEDKSEEEERTLITSDRNGERTPTPPRLELPFIEASLSFVTSRKVASNNSNTPTYCSSPSTRATGSVTAGPSTVLSGSFCSQSGVESPAVHGSSDTRFMFGPNGSSLHNCSQETSYPDWLTSYAAVPPPPPPMFHSAMLAETGCIATTKSVESGTNSSSDRFFLAQYKEEAPYVGGCCCRSPTGIPTPQQQGHQSDGCLNCREFPLEFHQTPRNADTTIGGSSAGKPRRTCSVEQPLFSPAPVAVNAINHSTVSSCTVVAGNNIAIPSSAPSTRNNCSQEEGKSTFRSRQTPGQHQRRLDTEGFEPDAGEDCGRDQTLDAEIGGGSLSRFQAAGSALATDHLPTQRPQQQQPPQAISSHQFESSLTAEKPTLSRRRNRRNRGRANHPPKKAELSTSEPSLCEPQCTSHRAVTATGEPSSSDSAAATDFTLEPPRTGAKETNSADTTTSNRRKDDHKIALPPAGSPPMDSSRGPTIKGVAPARQRQREQQQPSSSSPCSRMGLPIVYRVSLAAALGFSRDKPVMTPVDFQSPAAASLSTTCGVSGLSSMKSVVAAPTSHNIQAGVMSQLTASQQRQQPQRWGGFGSVVQPASHWTERDSTSNSGSEGSLQGALFLPSGKHHHHATGHHQPRRQPARRLYPPTGATAYHHQYSSSAAAAASPPYFFQNQISGSGSGSFEDFCNCGPDTTNTFPPVAAPPSSSGTECGGLGLALHRMLSTTSQELFKAGLQESTAAMVYEE